MAESDPAKTGLAGLLATALVMCIGCDKKCTGIFTA